MGTSNVNDISSGGIFPISGKNLTIPSETESGTYYILYYVDKGEYIDESNESNNVNYKQVNVHLPKPDLIVLSENVTPTTIQANTSFETSCTVKNNGDADANHTKLRYYLSQNTTYESANDTELGWDPVKDIGGLNANISSPETADLDMPDWALGNYYT